MPHQDTRRWRRCAPIDRAELRRRAAARSRARTEARRAGVEPRVVRDVLRAFVLYDDDLIAVGGPAAFSMSTSGVRAAAGHVGHVLDARAAGALHGVLVAVTTAAAQRAADCEDEDDRAACRIAAEVDAFVEWTERAAVLDGGVA